MLPSSATGYCFRTQQSEPSDSSSLFYPSFVQMPMLVFCRNQRLHSKLIKSQWTGEKDLELIRHIQQLGLKDVSEIPWVRTPLHFKGISWSCTVARWPTCRKCSSCAAVWNAEFWHSFPLALNSPGLSPFQANACDSPSPFSPSVSCN